MGLSASVTECDRMGGDRVLIEPRKHNELKNDAIIWHICYEGGVFQFIKRINSYDEDLSVQFTMSWADRKVFIGGISFEVNE